MTVCSLHDACCFVVPPDMDAQHTLAKMELYQKYMRQRDIRGLMFYLRQDLLRGHTSGCSVSMTRSPPLHINEPSTVATPPSLFNNLKPLAHVAKQKIS
jgi:hypothetical protein